jgi:formamidopyrimidine-DNA glycosylase
MPELPEVETTCRGIRPHIKDKTIQSATVRQAKLRWPIPQDLNDKLRGQRLREVHRRAKYLLLDFDNGCLIIHLGMSGSLRILSAPEEPAKHDHVDIAFDDGYCLRYHDPRRFGAILWSDTPGDHELLHELGPEPLSEDFNGEHLFKLAKNKTTPVKSFLMNGRNVVGVGNIYASEALFMAGIHPNRAAGKISLARYTLLSQTVKDVLSAAIQQGGTTLKDFVGGDGKPGYFAQQLLVYGKANEACSKCERPIKQVTIAQRSSFYCPHCQR